MGTEQGRSAAVVGAAVVAVMAVIVGAAVFVLTRSSNDATDADPARPGVDVADPAVITADRFAAALSTGDFADAPTSGAVDAAQLGEQVQFTWAGLRAGGASGPQVTVVDVQRNPGADAGTAEATARYEWTFPGNRVWTYDTDWLLVEDAEAAGDRRWAVSFDASMLLPSMGGNRVVQVSRVPATRGRIVDGGGRSLTPGGGTVTIGIRKSRTDDPAGTARTVASLTGVDPDELVARVEAAGADEFVEVTTLERSEYDLIRATIQPLPGTVFTEESDATELPLGYARGVLGVAGPATPEIAAASEGRVAEGDTTGLSGIQFARDSVLAGSPGLRIEAIPTDGSGDRTLLKEFPAEPGRDVVVTLDPAVQTAADAALAGVGKPTGLVAVRVSTGEVLAVSNGPSGSAGYNRALINRYPPGSTFKVVSALAYMEAGLGPDDVVGCPATTVAGKRFKNAGNFELGDVPFRRAFARSCNTTFVDHADTITSQQLSDTAALLGFRDLDAELGIDVFGTPVPVTEEPTEHAADTIGQGKVEGNALSVALMSASIANGSSLSPRLFVEPVDPNVPPEQAPQPGPRPQLPAGPVTALREMMRLVVTDGTGSALAGVPGDPVHAKTGTAEFGTDDPPRSHAWITGYQGDIAFAVVVEDGGGGGAVAAPIAADFLTRLTGG